MSANNLKRIQKFEVLKKKRKGEAQKSKESITEVVKVKKTGILS